MTAGASATTIDFHGQRCVEISLPQGDRAVISLFGAQVLSWRTADGTERFFLSPKAVMDGSAPIRGGVPICFPQFNQRALSGRGVPRHGFVREQVWSAGQGQRSGALAEVTLSLASSPETLAIWPHSFSANLTLRLEPNTLRTTFGVRNISDLAWPFAFALHSYLAVDDIAATKVHGLGGRTFWDGVKNLREPHLRAVQHEGPLDFNGETDRVYEGIHAPIELDHAGTRLRITQSESLPDAVVWNPAAKLCATLEDMPSDGWKRMVCLEAARINVPQVLSAGQSWSGWQQFEAA